MSDIDALRQQLLVTERVNVAGGAGFDVGGVSLDSILRIFRRHSTQLRDLFDNLVVGAKVSLDQASALGGALLSSAPEIAAEIIAEAAGYSEPEAVALFRELGGPIQLDALDKIAGLTFTTETPPKKVIETVARMLRGVSLTLIGDQEA
jgi:phage-related tail protein